MGIAEGIGRNDRKTGGFDLKKIVWEDAFSYIAVAKLEPHPEAFRFGPGLEDLAAGFGGGFEVPNEC